MSKKPGKFRKFMNGLDFLSAIVQIFLVIGRVLLAGARLQIKLFDEDRGGLSVSYSMGRE